jgi:hypothetical protein
MLLEQKNKTTNSLGNLSAFSYIFLFIVYFVSSVMYYSLPLGFIIVVKVSENSLTFENGDNTFSKIFHRENTSNLGCPTFLSELSLPHSLLTCYQSFVWPSLRNIYRCNTTINYSKIFRVRQSTI